MGIKLKDIALINISGSSSSSSTASKLGSSTIGSATQPIYLNGGSPVTCTYTLAKSVPADAKFTDTTYSAATTSAAGLMSAADKTKLDGITASADTVSFTRSLTSGTKIGTITINGTGTDLYCQTNTDTNTTYSAGTGLSLSGTSFSVNYGTSAGTACQGNDSRLSNSRPASDVYSWAKASSKPSYSWSEITSKPSVAIQATTNNFVHSGNEITMVPSGYTGDVYLNYRTCGGTNGNITGYILGNGKGGSLGTAIHTGNIGSQSVSYASSSGYLNVTACSSSSNSKAWNSVTVDTLKLKVWDVYSDGGPETYGNILEINGIANHWKPQLWFDAYTGQMRVRNRSYNSTSWNSWRVVIDSANCTSYNSNYSNYTGYVSRERGCNSVSTLASLPVTKSVVLASLSGATSISLAAHMNIGESITVICTPSASFTQPLPTSGSFISMDGSSLSVTSGKKFEINILCYNTNVYSISCKTAS